MKTKKVKKIIYFFSLVLIFIAFVNIQSLVTAKPALQISPTPTKTPPPFSHSEDLDIDIRAPWLSNIAFHAGRDGSFFGDEPAHNNNNNSRDFYALDFNGDTSTNEPINDAGVIVLAVADGTVRDVGYDANGYGHYVVIAHQGGYLSRYAHLREKPVVNEGDIVLQGDPLGYIGNSGTTGAHLHFAMYYCDPNLSEEDCNKPENRYSQKPNPLEGINNYSDGYTFTSTNIGVGYKPISPSNKVTIDELNNETNNNFRTTYEYFGGQEEVFGVSLLPVVEFGHSGYYFQTFGDNFAKGSDFFGIPSTLFDDGNIAYLLTGKIWSEYLNKGGPNSSLGLPTTHSYPWGQNLYSGNPTSFRNDFQNGSIIWEKNGGVRILDEKNSAWKVTIYEMPNFTSPVLTRFDDNINFSWIPPAQCFPMRNNIQLGSSFIANTELKGLLAPHRIEAEFQGTLEIIADGKVLISKSSPNAITKVNSPYISPLTKKIEVKFSQSPLNEAKVKISAQSAVNFDDLFKVYAAENDFIEISYIQESEIPNIIGYDPPPYPGSNNFPTQHPLPIGNVDSSTVMVLDTSGSMDEADITGLSKLQAAQRAAGNILNIASSEAQQSNTITTSLGLVNYNNSAAVNLDLTTDYSNLQNEINNLSAGGGTGMAEGLQTGIGLFRGSSSNEKQMIILLSDGMANIPIDSALSYDEEGIKQEVINLASQAGSQGICVYTIGFGVPGTTGSISWDASIDEEFLMEVAAASGCGSYYNAQDSIQLSNVFVELRHTSMGNVLFERTGQIAQGEEIDLGTVAIPANQELALFTLNWPGSKLELNIQDPAGTPVDENYPGATFALSPSIVSVVLSNPMPGDWRLGILGVDVPEGTTAFNSIVSARVGLTTAAPVSPTPQPAVIPSGSGNTGAVIFLLVAASVGLILFIYVQSKDRTKKAVFNSQLVGVSGLFAGQSIVVRDRFTVGRAAGSNLVLHDPGVSRNHVQFRYANGAWFIQDVGSSAGTYVNGKRVTGQRLSNGDQVQIGNQVFTFHVGGQ